MMRSSPSPCRGIDADQTEGPLKTLASAIKTAEHQAEQIDLKFGSRDGQVPLTFRDRERISKNLHARLDNWRGLLRRHVPQVRQLLRKLLVDLPQGIASPTGYTKEMDDESTNLLTAGQKR